MQHCRLKNRGVMMLTAVLCCIAWGSSLPAIKLSYMMFDVTGEFEKILLGGLRFGLSGLGVLVYARLKRKSIFINRKTVPLTILVSFLQTFGGMTLGYIGVSYTTGVKSSILIPTSVFMVAILAHFMFKHDRLTWRKVVGLLLGFGGVVVVNMSLLGNKISSFRFMGEGFLLVSVAMSALTVVLIRKYGSRIDVLLVSGWQMFIGGILMAVVGFAGRSQPLRFDIASSLLFLYLAVVSGVCFTLWFLLLKYHNASLIEQYKFIIPVSGSLISVIILQGEHIGIEILIAVVLVSAGTVIVNPQERVQTF